MWRKCSCTPALSRTNKLSFELCHIPSLHTAQRVMRRTPTATLPLRSHLSANERARPYSERSKAQARSVQRCSAAGHLRGRCPRRCQEGRRRHGLRSVPQRMTSGRLGPSRRPPATQPGSPHDKLALRTFVGRLDVTEHFRSPLTSSLLPKVEHTCARESRGLRHHVHDRGG